MHAHAHSFAGRPRNTLALHVESYQRSRTNIMMACCDDSWKTNHVGQGERKKNQEAGKA